MTWTLLRALSPEGDIVLIYETSARVVLTLGKVIVRSRCARASQPMVSAKEPAP